MVNYLYDPGSVEQNHEDFVARLGIAAARGARALARAAAERGPEARAGATPARPEKETARDCQPAP